jgi:tetratricopeptide (TPR) repeat protein
MSPRTLACAVTMCVTAALAGAQQSASPSPTFVQAESLAAHKDFRGAARLLEQVVQSEPQNGRAWYRLGLAREELGFYQSAADAFERAAQIGQNPVVWYYAATMNARAGHRDRALAALDTAGIRGFNMLQMLQTDSAWTSMRDDPRFLKASRSIKLAAQPCDTASASRQFDFWIGNWKVTDQTGRQVGTSRIESILGKCVILENWTDIYGGSGKSFNAYDAGRGEWRQFWVDEQGSVNLFTEGKYADGKLVYHNEVYRNGTVAYLRRLTFFNLGPDRVRQFSERSDDRGATWSTEYDFIYARVK